MKPYELEDKTATVQYIIENSSAFAGFATMNEKKTNCIFLTCNLLMNCIKFLLVLVGKIKINRKIIKLNYFEFDGRALKLPIS